MNLKYAGTNSPQYWDAQWSSSKRMFPRYTMNIICWQIPFGSSVLDIGCGNGRFLRQIQKERKPTKLFGIDISPEAIRRMKDSGIDGLVATAEDLDDFDQEFDVVTACHLLEHVENDVGLIKNIARIAKKMAIFAVPNDCSYPEPTGEHVRKYSLQSLTDLLKPHFRKIENHTRLNRRHTKNHLIVVAKK